MKLTKVRVIYRKEMLDLLRDKKTMIMMILVPLVLYPLIMLGSMVMTSTITKNLQEGEYNVAISDDGTGEYDREELINLIEDSKDEFEYHLKVTEAEDPKRMLLEEEIDAYALVNRENEKLHFEIHYLSTVSNSNTASDMLRDKLEMYAEHIEEETLKELGLNAEQIMEPVEIAFADQSSKEESFGNLLGMILPFLLIMSILMGAMYPAIDTTAGEKERGTMETLLTLPLRNDELIMGKFLAVATVAIISALLNLISMGFVGGYLYSMMASVSDTAMEINLISFLPVLGIVILCVIAFALFISAVTMCTTAFAKSFKEANNYITPMMLIVMFAGFIGFIPNIDFNVFLAAVPVVNISLLITNMMVFNYDISLVLVVLLTNVAYAVLAIWFLSKIYNSENILFGEGGSSMQIFSRRQDLKAGGVPNISDGILVMAVSVFMLLFVGSVVQMKLQMTGMLITQLMIIAVPAFAAWYTKKDLKDTFSLRIPRISGVAGAVFLEIGTFLAVTLVGVVLNKIWPQDAQNVTQSFEYIFQDTSFPAALLIIAAAPAICEEALFRGYLLSSVKKKLNPAAAVLIVAALFGIYHLSLVKFFTTGLLGIAFGYVVYKTGSILLSSIMHFINNAISVVIIFYAAELESLMPVLFQEDIAASEVVKVIAAALICIGLGVFLIQKGSQKQRS